MRPKRSPPQLRPGLRSATARAAVGIAIAVAAALHLNYWLWDADWLVFGLPVNLFYHVVLTLVLSCSMWALVHWYWPSFLDGKEPE